MRRLTGAVLILIATATACSHPTAQSPGPEPGAATTSEAPRPTMIISSATAMSPLTPIPTSAPTTSAWATSQLPGDFASDLIQGLIDHRPTVAAFDTSLWSAALDGGSKVQVATLSNSAGRADVAVSVAFQETAMAANAEPIGLRVQLGISGSNWVVDGIGYL